MASLSSRRVNQTSDEHKAEDLSSRTKYIGKPCIPLMMFCVHFMVALIFLLTFVWVDTSDTADKYMGGLSFSKNDLMRWHALLMTWALGFMVEGTLVYRSLNLRTTRHATKKRLHLVFHACAAVLFSAGLACAFRAKEESHMASLYSTHSWLGLFTVVLFYAQFVCGAAVYALKGFPRLLIKQRMFPVHAAVGVASLAAACAATLSGIDHYNTLVGCAYSVVNQDLDPALHYWDIPSGCRTSNWLALLVLATLVLAVYATANLKGVHVESLEGDKDSDNNNRHAFAADAASSSLPPPPRSPTAHPAAAAETLRFFYSPLSASAASAARSPLQPPSPAPGGGIDGGSLRSSAPSRGARLGAGAAAGDDDDDDRPGWFSDEVEGFVDCLEEDHTAERGSSEQAIDPELTHLLV